MDIFERAIQTTLAYFDAFDRPLTKEELWQWLWTSQSHVAVPASYTDFLEVLDAAARTRSIESIDGYYALPGRASIVQMYQRTLWLVEKKMRIARRAITFIRAVPFVRAVFVCNTVAMGSPKEDSDIDVFIIIKNGRLWLSRLLVTLLLSLFRLRRTKTKINNRIDLSFYTVDTNLNLAPVRMFPDDIYMLYWLTQLIPMYDPEDFLTRIQEENPWVHTFVPRGFQPYQALHRWRVEDKGCIKKVRSFFERLWGGRYGDILESQARQAQLFKMKLNIYSVKDAHDTRVVVSDQMLKFHENDRRTYYRQLWQEKVSHST